MTDDPDFAVWAGLPAPAAVDLARFDQDARWQAGVGLPVEQYLAALPGVAADSELAMVLVYGEVLSRAAVGERPTAAEYRARFQHWADRIDLQFALHAALHPSEESPTRTRPLGEHTPTRTHAPLDHAGLLLTLTRGLSAPPPPDAPFRFGAGTVLAGRYRIVAPLGKGGMGEVYRADDITLGQSVALKFLPEHVAANPATLERFRKEVAAARQVAHPHVCRVFDIGEAGGQVFLSMEFIPGDDLAGVLRKAGRLSSGLAIDLTRQVAAGLHAVHDEGLVHRDLKPANVMVDGKGRARLTDFGLAATAESISGPDAFSGTPAYQAPEQLSGGTISERTDVYALGLLAYELLTGQRPFDATDRKQLIEQQRTTKPASPSSFDATIPPEVDRIILRCLAHDPKDRPASAHEVWRTLPGDAALNAALAAGVTPTAEAVADAGGEGRLKRWVAVLLAGVVLLLVLSVGLMQFTTHQQDHATELRPVELDDRCRTLLADTGHPTDLPFAASGVEIFRSSTLWRDQHDLGMDRRDTAAMQRFSGVLYWYRVSPTPLIPSMPAREQPLVRSDRPAFGSTGSALVMTDTQGRLVHLKRLPPAVRSKEPIPTPDWPAWFRAAGFDMTQFRLTAPERVWTVPHDARYAWAGVFAERPSIPVTIEAATDRGELVGFRVVAPWSSPAESDSNFTLEMESWYQVWWIAVPVLVFVVGGWLAYRHVRSGVADVRGAVRLALGVSALHLLMYVLYIGRLDLTGEEYSTWYSAVARVLLNALRLGMAYLALEPFVRRRWPRLLVGWRRLLEGRWRDPWIGRDILVGLALGTLAAALNHSFLMLPGTMGRPPELPTSNQWVEVQPFHVLLPLLLVSVDVSLVVLFALFCLSRLLRTAWLWVPAVLGVVTFGTFGGLGEGGANPEILKFLILILAIFVLVQLLRFGLLAQITGFIAGLLTSTFPILYGWGTWFWPASLLPWVLVLSLTGYGLLVSVGGWKRLVRADTAG